MQEKAKEPEFKIEVQYDRLVSGYKPGDTVSGYIKLVSTRDKSFRVDVNQVNMRVKGGIVINASNSNKALQSLIAKGASSIYCIETDTVQLEKNKTIDQSTKMLFRFKLEQKDHPYQESYIGMYISVNYLINVEFKLTDGRILNDDIPFFVQVYQSGRSALDCEFQYPKPKMFLMTEEKCKFKMRGEFASEICMFGDDFEGVLTIDSTDVPIKTVNLQLIRVERIEYQGQNFCQKTEIQLIQVCDGNVTPKLDIPIYMMFPKYHCCPSVSYKGFKVDFQINLHVVFKGGFSVSCNQPIKVLRS